MRDTRLFTRHVAHAILDRQANAVIQEADMRRRSIGSVGLTFATAAIPMRVHLRGGTLFIALLLTIPVTLPPLSSVAAVAGEVGNSGRKS